MLRDGVDPSVIAAYVLDFVAETLAALSSELRNSYGEIPIVYAGGVMCNKRIRARLSSFGDTSFAAPAFSADNAAGIALLCKKRHGGSYADRI
jgi:N6-L-threonylcarbamoyladenine synthase